MFWTRTRWCNSVPLLWVRFIERLNKPSHHLITSCNKQLSLVFKQTLGYSPIFSGLSVNIFLFTLSFSLSFPLFYLSPSALHYVGYTDPSLSHVISARSSECCLRSLLPRWQTMITITLRKGKASRGSASLTVETWKFQLNSQRICAKESHFRLEGILKLLLSHNLIKKTRNLFIKFHLFFPLTSPYHHFLFFFLFHSYCYFFFPCMICLVSLLSSHY